MKTLYDHLEAWEKQIDDYMKEVGFTDEDIFEYKFAPLETIKGFIRFVEQKESELPVFEKQKPINVREFVNLADQIREHEASQLEEKEV